jgi:SAM-dependent methyltransferase
MLESITDPGVREGHYAAKQIFCRAGLIAWSHRRRFEVGLRLARRFAGRRILDYGCGDATFLALLQATPDRPTASVGAELDDVQVEDCRRRFAGRAGLAFVNIAELDGSEHIGAYDAVVCMEVLEHVVALDEVLARLWRVLAADGTALVSVPVETGLPLVVKQTVRRVAGWRGIGDYPGTSPYTIGELCAGVVAGSRPHVRRPVHGVDGPTPFHDHKGFNWMVLRARLAAFFEIDEVVAAPLPWLGPHLATQVWFVGRKRRVPEKAV